ncbi:ATP-binding protein [Methanocella arvoryzae]|uniref:ATP-binding protein n=1 Tax=Methanocella arvoryzae (strain DSM 22066 / NBRC 105507 / MRE50) TaxID=351160 RepID=Q0W1Z8_METAR|nr:ATP-binding protein [Methanocella arvoryzae]CAJ37595.1 conserved hypothetical protein [Methanocella arvoryzae MRE50]
MGSIPVGESSSETIIDHSLNIDEYDIVPPDPASFIESLRAFGYDLQTAIADIIDNSISAGARNVYIVFNWDGANSTISIKDDGCGMTESELIKAMRLGSISPSDCRNPKDLGRFGLGLKTASFSQCRKFTVASKFENNPIAIRCWDIDYIIKTHDWHLLRINNKELPLHFTDLNDLKSGTIVLWEKLDVICKNTDVNDPRAKNLFLTRIENVKKHLSMTFHRYLERHKIKIFINDRIVEPWDPYLRNEKATQILNEESRTIFGSKIVVIPYVLPHHSKIDSETYNYAEGPNGWAAQQGFYVYRNERLIVAGSWLGLGIKKFDHYKLARIQVDIPNSMDREWELDVRKSIARPPDNIRDDLKKIASLTIGRAMEIYRHRGKVIARNSLSEHTFLWQKKVYHGKISYTINREHPVISSILTNSSVNISQVKMLLKLIEETVPVSLIIVDNAEAPDKQATTTEKKPSDELKVALLEMYFDLINSGFTHDKAKEKIVKTEPFDNYLEYVCGLLDKAQEGNLHV